MYARLQAVARLKAEGAHSCKRIGYDGDACRGRDILVDGSACRCIWRGLRTSIFPRLELVWINRLFACSFQETQAYSDKLSAIRGRMARIDMPNWLQTSIFDYYQYLYERFTLVDDQFDNFLVELPEHIHMRVKWCMHGQSLTAVYLFQDCTEFFVMQACPSATVLLYKMRCKSPHLSTLP